MAFLAALVKIVLFLAAVFVLFSFFAVPLLFGSHASPWVIVLMSAAFFFLVLWVLVAEIRSLRRES